jgi:DNA-binding NarL/FixJ family response regulator
MPGPSLPVFIVSDVRLYRDGIVWGLAASARLQVVGTAENAPTALHRLVECAVQVVLVDMSMEGALELIRAVSLSQPDLRIVAFAVGRDDHSILACIEAGATGYVGRDGTIEDLVSTIESVSRGETRCPPRVVASLCRRVAALAGAHDVSASLVVLTQRERQIVELLDQGLSNREIATELGIELATAKNHVHHILEKLQVRRRSQVGGRLGWRKSAVAERPRGAAHRLV